MQTRVIVSFPVSEGKGYLVERMHALKRKNGIYVLDNSPFYAFGISCGDSFLASPNEDGELVFSEIVARGGHSTYRVKLPIESSHDDFLAHWPALEGLGCTYEGSSANVERLYSIDVPTGSDVFEVYRLLEEGEQKKVWLFEEGYYFRPRPTE